MKKHLFTTIRRAVPIAIIMVLSWVASIMGLLEEGGGTLRVVEIFLGTFFVAMGLLKCVNLSHFVGILTSYDGVARRFRHYAYAYPFIEILLGLAYLGEVRIEIMSIVTALFLGVTAFSLFRTLMRHEHPRCACMGTVFYMEVSWFSLFEYALLMTCVLFTISQYYAL